MNCWNFSLLNHLGSEIAIQNLSTLRTMIRLTEVYQAFIWSRHSGCCAGCDEHRGHQYVGCTTGQSELHCTSAGLFKHISSHSSNISCNTGFSESLGVIHMLRCLVQGFPHLLTPTLFVGYNLCFSSWVHSMCMVLQCIWFSHYAVFGNPGTCIPNS